MSFLSTMEGFHKYAVADLTSFAIEAPAMFTAVASAEFWEKHFPDMPRKRAEKLVGALIGCFTRFLNEKPLKNDSRGFYGAVCKKFISAVVSDEADTELSK